MRVEKIVPTRGVEILEPPPWYRPPRPLWHGSVAIIVLAVVVLILALLERPPTEIATGAHRTTTWTCVAEPHNRVYLCDLDGTPR